MGKPMDKYHSLAALKAALKENVDYRVALFKRKSWATIMSPHGGFIEPGTSALAKAVAADIYNLYDFQGLRKEAGQDLHVTATRFRDPLLTPVLRRSCVAVSFHSMGPSGQAIVWLGGRNRLLKDLVLQKLREKSFAVNPDSPRYRGESPKNLVNLACHEGVQLELSDELIAELFPDGGFSLESEEVRTSACFDEFVKAINLALADYAAKSCTGPCHTAVTEQAS